MTEETNYYRIRLTQGDMTIALESKDVSFASRQMELWYDYFKDAPLSASSIATPREMNGQSPSYDTVPTPLPSVLDSLPTFDEPEELSPTVTTQRENQRQLQEITNALSELFDENQVAQQEPVPPPQAPPKPVAEPPVPEDMPDVHRHQQALALMEQAQQLQKQAQDMMTSSDVDISSGRLDLPVNNPSQLTESLAQSFQTAEQLKTPALDAGLIDTLSMPAYRDADSNALATQSASSSTSFEQPVNKGAESVQGDLLDTLTAPAQTQVSSEKPPISTVSQQPVNNLGKSEDATVGIMGGADYPATSVIGSATQDFEQVLDAALADPNPPAPVEVPESELPPMPASMDDDDDVETLYIDTFKDLCELAPNAIDPSHLALLGAYFIQQLMSQPSFTLKDLNQQLTQAKKEMANHGLLEDLMSQSYVVILPDKTGTALATVYQLTDEGIDAVEAMLDIG